jgi:GTPase SAR1 family protein
MEALEYTVMLQSLPQWIEECDRHNLTGDVPRILVGNKCDCKEKQVVRTNAAQRFADFHNMPVSYPTVFACIMDTPWGGIWKQ